MLLIRICSSVPFYGLFDCFAQFLVGAGVGKVADLAQTVCGQIDTE